MRYFILVVALVCTTVACWPVQAQDYEEPNYGEVLGDGTDAYPFIDGFGPFPLAYRCPDEPHHGQTCEPGKWYVGSLFSDTAFDLSIRDALGHRRYKADWATCEEEKRRIETGTGIVIDTKSEQLAKVELRAFRAERGQPILFGVGIGLGVAATILIVVLVERSGDDSAETDTMGVGPSIARW